MVAQQGATLSSQLRFVWAEPTDWADLAQQWRQIEANAAQEVFLSWAWIDTWQFVYQSAHWVCRVYDQEKLVAVGLWARTNHKRPFGFNVRCLHLQHTGLENFDQIWPEYSELLCLPDYRQEVHSQLLSHIPKSLKVSEIDLGVCDAQLCEWMIQKHKKRWLCEERWRSVSISVATEAFATFEDYLASLSSSFQYQLRRTQKGLETLGPISLEFADSSEQCQQWLMEDAHWHKQQWGQGSGFYNSDFERFHLAWIERAFAQGLVQVVRLLAGDTLVSGAYLFQYRNTLYFYLGFARQEWGAKVKTGLCLHLFLIRYCIENSIANYDFMGGDYPYKRKFGQPTRTLVRCRFKPINLMNLCEQKLKAVKHKLSRSNDAI